MQRGSTLLFSVVLAFALGSRATQTEEKFEELGRTFGLPVDMDVGSDGTKPPTYLKKLYDCWSSDGSSTGAAAYGDCPSREEFAADENVDLIRSFVGTHDTAATDAVQSYNTEIALENSMRIVFNTSCSMHHKETVYSAEIHIYNEGISKAQLKGLCPNLKLSSGLGVQLYIESGTTGDRPVASLVKRVTLSKDELTSGGWVVFKNVTKVFTKFLGAVFNRTHNHSAAIRLALEGPCSGVHPADIGFTTEEEDKEATITGFFKSGPTGVNGMTSLTKVVPQQRKRSASSSGNFIEQNPMTRTLSQLQGQDCQLHHYEVSFADLGWEEFVIKPERYIANFCYGKCHAPLDRSHNTTRHSYIQTIVNSVNTEYVPEACCVPSQLAPLSVIYREGPKTFTLQIWEDMRATACGCR